MHKLLSQLLDNWGLSLGWAIVLLLVGRLLYKHPRVREFFRPDETHDRLMEDREELEKEIVKLREKLQRLRDGNEFLLDELAIVRIVRDNQRDRLDAALAEVEILKSRVDSIRQTVNRESLG